MGCLAGLKEAHKAYDEGNYSVALKEFMSLAEQNDAEAQLYLASMYIQGKGVPYDDLQALNWCRRAAEQGNTQAQSLLGKIYLQGGVGFFNASNASSNICSLGVMIQPEERISGVLYPTLFPQDYAQAAKWLHKAVEQGNADAQCLLGLLYRDGLGVEKNSLKEFSLFSKAAEQGNVTAQYNLGEIYYYGQEVTQNYFKAFNWYSKAAEQDDNNAQYTMGELYYNGQGTTQNYEQALNWFRKAAEKGNVNAKMQIASMYYNGEGTPQNYLEASKLYRSMAENNNYTVAQWHLAYMYENGLGVTKNLVLAHMLYNLVASLGNTTNKRDKIATQLTPAQLAEAQDLASKWKIGTRLPTTTKTYLTHKIKKK